ncbi:MAG: DUF5677 domain-containing protein [Syntrophales bacterium]|jgi:hypothetical protein
MTKENEEKCSCHQHYEQLKIFEEYFIFQFQLLHELIDKIDKKGRPGRLNYLGVLLFSIISNAKSIVNLIGGGFIPEAYIISRSYFEKCVNFCYLNVCDEREYENYVDWSHQKIIRALYTKQKAYKNIGHNVPLPDILPLIRENKELKKFSGKKGGEKPNWTDVSLYHRIKFIENKINKKTCAMYLAAMNMIYEDASENIHGTLYGATFHTAIFYGINKTDEDKQKYLIGLGFTLYMLLGILIQGICELVSIYMPVNEIIKKSEDNFDNKIQNYYKDQRKQV